MLATYLSNPQFRWCGPVVRADRVLGHPVFGLFD